MAIKVVAHKDTNLLMGFSDDLKGLLVPARSWSEMQARLAPAIREILEAQGNVVLEVEPIPDDDALDGFVSRSVTASAVLAAA